MLLTASTARQFWQHPTHLRACYCILLAMAQRQNSEVKVIQPYDPNVDRRVIYECNFSVESAVVEEFVAYLRAHMKEIVGLDNGKLFDRATLCVAENEGVHDSNRSHLCARYRARSRFRLQEYFDKAGDRLRKDMLEKWGGRFEVQRRILVIDSVIEAGAEGMVIE